jgi:hypothetical protein
MSVGIVEQLRQICRNRTTDEFWKRCGELSEIWTAEGARPATDQVCRLKNLSTKNRLTDRFFIPELYKSRQVSLDRLFSEPYFGQEGKAGLKYKKQFL